MSSSSQKRFGSYNSDKSSILGEKPFKTDGFGSYDADKTSILGEAPFKSDRFGSSTGTEQEEESKCDLTSYLRLIKQALQNWIN